MTYYGTGYTKPTNQTAVYKTSYSAEVALDRGKNLSGVAVYVDSQILEYGQDYLWEKTAGNVYTLIVNAEFVSDHIEVYVYVEDNNESTNVSVTYENQYTGRLIRIKQYYTDPKGLGESDTSLEASKFATPGKDYLAYITEIPLINVGDSVEVKCGDRILVENVDYTYEKSEKLLLNRYRLVIFGSSITDDITITPY